MRRRRKRKFQQISPRILVWINNLRKELKPPEI
jgi:hypothetical protein